MCRVQCFVHEETSLLNECLVHSGFAPGFSKSGHLSEATDQNQTRRRYLRPVRDIGLKLKAQDSSVEGGSGNDRLGHCRH